MKITVFNYLFIVKMVLNNDILQDDEIFELKIRIKL